MKAPETCWKIIREWMGPAKDKREIEERMQRIVNAFFFGVAIFSVAFAYFVLSVRTQDQYRAEHAQLDRLFYGLIPSETSFLRGHPPDAHPASHGQGQ
jgi:hypothetical protein